jgi:hypothetical protein
VLVDEAMMMLFAYLWLLAAPAMAPAEPQGALSFQATLDSIKINAQPAQVVTRQFRLTLDQNQRPTHFKARVEDWWRSEDGKESFYGAPGTLRRSCAEWVSLNPVESTVQPGETLAIRLSVALPNELQGGGFWCALTVDEIPDPLATQEGVGVRFVASVSVGIFVYVEPVQRDAAILDVEVRAGEAHVKVRNEGNVPLGIEGRLEFFAPGGSAPMATIDISRRTLLTEPTRDGIVRSTLPPPTTLPSGHYRVRAILDFGADHYIGAEREVAIVREVRASDPPR